MTIHELCVLYRVSSAEKTRAQHGNPFKLSHGLYTTSELDATFNRGRFVGCRATPNVWRSLRQQGLIGGSLQWPVLTDAGRAVLLRDEKGGE